MPGKAVLILLATVLASGVGASWEGGEEDAYDWPPKPLYLARAVIPDSLTDLARSLILVTLTLDRTGAVVDASIARSEAHPVLERAALAAARKSFFRPARQRQIPVACRITLPFRLPGSYQDWIAGPCQHHGVLQAGFALVDSVLGRQRTAFVFERNREGETQTLRLFGPRPTQIDLRCDYQLSSQLDDDGIGARLLAIRNRIVGTAEPRLRAQAEDGMLAESWSFGDSLDVLVQSVPPRHVVIVATGRSAPDLLPRILAEPDSR